MHKDCDKRFFKQPEFYRLTGGNNYVRIDAEDKVTGRGKYAGDIMFPGMLTGKFVRSTRAHAKILSIDTSEAEKLPGVYAVLTGLAVANYGILPGFLAGYIVAFVVKFLEKKVPAGLDLIVIILTCAPLARLIAEVMQPIVNGTLLQIGQVLLSATNASPIVMGIILGGLITVVATAPLSSMALTAMLGLTGTPMAIGALAVFGSSFMNYVFFHKMQFGSKKDTIAVAIEPLTQADIISANPLPVYVTNFIGGAMSGIIIALMGLTNMTPGTATPIAGFAVMFAYNDPVKVLIAAAGCIVVSVIGGFIGHAIFKNTKIKTAAEIRGELAVA